MNDFKHPIQIFREAVCQDDIGNEIVNIELIMNCRARINGNGWKRQEKLSSEPSEDDLTFEVRYCSSLSRLIPSELSIGYNGRVYNVESVDDYYQQHKTLKIRAVLNSES